MRLVHLVLASAALSGVAAHAATLQGTATIRERIALPEDAELEVRLEDVSRADAPATILGRATLAPSGRVPYRFAVDYDDSRVSPHARTTVRALLNHRGQLIRTGAMPVELPAAAPVEIVMTRTARAQPLGALPASFVGEIPGAGGPVRWQVDLLPGDRYQQRLSFVDKPEPNRFDSIGRVRTRGSKLHLVGSDAEPTWLEIVNPRTLRKLDPQGNRIASVHNDLLVRRDGAARIEPQLALSGLFVYSADAARITLCADGRSLPVAMEGAYIDLERAYLAQAGAPGAPLLVELQGAIVPRPPMEGPGPVPTLRADRFGAAWPREGCGQPLATSPLAETYWKLTRLNGQPVTVAEGQREPHLVLRGNGGVGGSGGCNRINGSWQRDGEAALKFGRMASTTMACPTGMDTEQALFKALAEVSAHRIRGSHLEVLGAAGTVLARFESVALR